MREKAEEEEEQRRAINLEHKDATRLMGLEQENPCKTATLIEVYGCRDLKLIAPSPKDWLLQTKTWPVLIGPLQLIPRSFSYDIKSNVTYTLTAILLNQRGFWLMW